MVTSQPFEYIIFTLIIANTITLGMKFYGQPEVYTQALDVLNMVSTSKYNIHKSTSKITFYF